MIPAVITVMMLVGFILPYLNEGPLWNQKVDTAAGNCKASFWYNVLAVGNIFGTDRLVRVLKIFSFFFQNLKM